MSSVAVVILNWNGKELLKKFLPSVIKNTPAANIYLADNCSTDDSVDFVNKNFPEVKIIINSCNHGYANGYNEALAHLKEEIFVLLNSDVEVTQNWLSPLVKAIEPANVACGQPKIKSYREPEYFEYAGAAGGFIDKYGYPFCKGRIFSTLERDEEQYNSAEEIFWASGACMIIKSKYFWEAGGFDPDFFAHMEEIDLCWRLKNKGYKIIYCPASTVYHLGGGTLSKVKPRKTYLNFRNNLLMLIKNLSKEEVLSIVFTRLILDGVAAMKFLFEGSPMHLIAVLKAHFYCYFNLKKTYRKRSGQEKKLKDLGGVFPKAVIWQYFIKRKKKFTEVKSPR